MKTVSPLVTEVQLNSPSCRGSFFFVSRGIDTAGILVSGFAPQAPKQA